MPSPPRSLQARALQWLAQREQSRVELRRKLLRQATAEEAARVEGESTERATPDAKGDGDALAGQGSPADRAAARVDAVMAWLEAHHFVSDERFAESRAHARAARFGNLRIRLELKQHGVALAADTAQALQRTEWSRALQVWQRRFGQAPQTPAESAKQARLLMARGFSTDTVQRVLRTGRTGAGDTESSEVEDESPRDADDGRRAATFLQRDDS